MNEYVITFKYDNEGYMRHIVADCEDDAVGIAFARTRGMLKEFDAKNVTSLDVKEIGKKEIRSGTRVTFNTEATDNDWDEGEGPPSTPPVPVSRNPGQSPYPATMTPDEYSNRNLGSRPAFPGTVQLGVHEPIAEVLNRVTAQQYEGYQRQLNAAIDTVVPNNPGVYSRFVERLQQVPAWQPTLTTWDTQGNTTTG